MVFKQYGILRNGIARTVLLLLTSLFAAMVPTAAQAAGGEDVVLRFSSSDYVYLIISLVFGLTALLFAILIGLGVLTQSPGDEKMQEVGAAIKAGALAYLKRQVMTMGVFVVLLAIGLAILFSGKFGWAVARQIGACFVLGVAASYIAGYSGMIMAVNGNTRVAAAALASPKRALETAFRSGAVAGLVTVGMGLIGATAIFMFFPQDAMKLLVGFGFGGSLAALFMRVGGGIYTKAADVGADLVGKVEAGIPEDDPRNPATIADNVGDNVGDCAGMAADVFESYEVTLVAAIVLGAATAAIFDQATWMKLILFALMARGVGIIASIVGILSVRGNENVDSDPLMAIRRGFYTSAGIAALATIALAWLMMGGPKSPLGGTIQTTNLTAVQQFEQDERDQIRRIRDQIAEATGKLPFEVQATDILGDARFQALGIPEPVAQTAIMMATMSPGGFGDQPVPNLEGFTRVNFDDAANPVLRYAVQKIPDPGSLPPSQPEWILLKKAYEEAELTLFRVRVTPKPTEGSDEQTQPQPQEVWLGPSPREFFEKSIALPSVAEQVTVEVLEQIPAFLYSDKEGRLAVGIEASDKLTAPHRIDGPTGLNYYAMTPDEVQTRIRENRPLPPMENAALAIATHQTVPWFLFAMAIVVGILMAFLFEALTDYYVSAHKKPVREVTGVSTAGPAPMIISGFALGKESSVFALFGIVVALLIPLFLFPPATFGTLLLSFYGIALVGLGLLTTTGFILAMDTFGPISDNAQGVFEMSGAHEQSETGSKCVQRLDAAGNTTKALTKGFAIATAVVAATALFHSYVEGANLTGFGLPLDVPAIFLGLLIGGAAPYLFSAFSINAVGRAAFELINEVRRQFRTDPGIMAGTSKPDYGTCVAIVTKAAQKELLGPAVLAIALPLAVAFGFSIGTQPTEINGQMFNLTGAQALGGFLAGAILSGQLLAVMLANSGGIWDNAKKLIEDGMFGGKGTDAHKAGVVCDTVGDPFKDTAGPALNPLIKVMNLVALLLAGYFILPLSNNVLITITLVCVSALAFSIWWSKRSSMSTGMQEVVMAEALSSDAESPVRTSSKPRITVEDEEPSDKV